jgi:hypothetical protein
MPCGVNGKSSCLYVMPIVPFCPWRDLCNIRIQLFTYQLNVDVYENLSPISGMRWDLIRMRTMDSPSRVVLRMTWSTIPEKKKNAF